MDDKALFGRRILVVDDSEVSLELINKILQNEGFIVDTAVNGIHGLELFNDKEYDLVLLDVMMDGIDGFEVCKQIKYYGDKSNIPIIFITGATDYTSIIEGFELGAADYIVKPFFEAELLARIKTHLRLKLFQDNLEDLVKLRTEALELEIVQRKKTEVELAKSNQNINKLMHDTLELLASVVEIKDPLTSGHQKNVTNLSVAIGKAMSLDEHRLEGLRVAAMVHDIGKIKIPLEILSKGGKLHEAEIEIIRSHPETGYELLKEIVFPWPIAEIVYQHHERFDGSGYPRGLTGDEMLLEAQILSLADVVEAISFHRPYREGLGLNTAIDEIIKGRGTLFHPDIVDVCVTLLKEDSFSINNQD